MESLSVVIPLYNKAPFIRRTISSVMSQTKLPGEIIVIDDGSTDGGGEIVKQMENFPIRLVTQENKGVSVARNVGISLAKGELVAFLDADDEWYPRFLEVISDMRRHYPHAGAYATAFDIIDSKGRKLRKRFKGVSSHSNHQLIKNIFSEDIDPILLWTSAVVVPKTVFNKVGYFKEGEFLTEDIDMWTRIGIYFPIVFNNTVMATYHHDSTNRISKVHKFFREPSFSITISEAINYGKVPLEKVKGIKEFGAFWRYHAVRNLIENKQRDVAIEIINKTRGTKRFYYQGWILLVLAHLPPIFMKYLRKLYRSHFCPAN